MIDKQIGTQDNPAWIAVTGIQKPKFRDVVVVTAISIAPIAVAILMQKPALRQAIAMRFFHYSRVTCQTIADAFQDAATKAAMEYQKVRL